MLLPGLNWAFNQQSFGFGLLKMLDYICSGLLAPRALHSSLERLGFDRETIMILISSGVH